MRFPIGALLALAVVAAGSVVITAHFKHAAYTLNAMRLVTGDSMTVTLDFVPAKIYLLGDPASNYTVTVTVAGARFDVNGTRVSTITVTTHGNQTVTLYPVADVTGPVTCEITVTRAGRPPVM